MSAGEIGMRYVDAGIDHRDQNLAAACQLMRFLEPHFFRHVFRRIAFAWTRRWLLVLDQRVEIVRLCKQHARIGLKRAHHRRHRPAIRNPQPAAAWCRRAGS